MHGAGFSAPHRRKATGGSPSGPCRRVKPSGFAAARPPEAGRHLANRRGEDYVFRAAVLSIGLTLAAGQNAALVCTVWCHPAGAPTAGCEHQEASTSPSVKGNHDCPQIAAGPTAFVREDVRREGAAPHVLRAVVVPPFQFAPPPQSAFGRAPGQRPLLETRLLVLALRI